MYLSKDSKINVINYNCFVNVRKSCMGFQILLNTNLNHFNTHKNMPRNSFSYGIKILALNVFQNRNIYVMTKCSIHRN